MKTRKRRSVEFIAGQERVVGDAFFVAEGGKEGKSVEGESIR